MNEFWTRHNRRIGKLIDQDGAPTWRVRDWFVNAEGVTDPEGVATILSKRFEETHLGEVLGVAGNVVRCATAKGCALYAALLIKETLRDCKVPASSLIREGFPVPTIAHRIYKIERDANLEAIGPKNKKHPAVGDVFAYSFDRASYFWGQVVRNDVTHQLGATLVARFYRHESKGIDTVPMLDPNELITDPLVIDSGCWKRGLFVTVANQPVSGAADVVASGGWMTWESVDAELSIRHGVPLLA